ncbi:MAG: 16S rRNA (uracil(1498)-N(3))-methyltransferase [Pseudomonadota bacterium]
MPRFFIEKDRIRNNVAIIAGEEVKHITRVLRLGVGDKVILFDDAGWEYSATIKGGNSRELKGDILKKFLPQRESPLQIVLGQGLPRLSKMDLIVQKGTELGVSEIVPFHSSRSIPRLTEGKLAKRVERWQKIAREATKQCGRNLIPHICPPVDFAEILTRDLGGSLKLVLWEEGGGVGLKEILDTNQGKKGFFILVGPEGGFIANEIEKAREAGFHPVSMGSRILRTETASISILSVIQHRYGDLN